MITKKVAIVSGANRGLGLETARSLGRAGYKVIMIGRSLDRLKAAADELKKEDGSDVEYFQVDVTNDDQIRNLTASLRNRLGRIDVLINNAGVFPEAKDASTGEPFSVFKANTDVMQKTFDINTLGPLRLIQAFAPIMKENGYGRIVNVSSGMGGLTEMEGYYPAYRFSKSALNALTRVVSNELQKDGLNIKVNSVCPGWCRTDMGGPNATRTTEEGAKVIYWAATLDDDGPTGGFYRDGKQIPW